MYSHSMIEGIYFFIYEKENQYFFFSSGTKVRKRMCKDDLVTEWSDVENFYFLNFEIIHRKKNRRQSFYLSDR